MKGENHLIRCVNNRFGFFKNHRYSKSIFIIEMTFAQKEFMIQIISSDTTEMYGSTVLLPDDLI
jgi:hypothetical protein